MSHISKTTWVLENVLDKLTYNTNGCQLSCRDSTYRISSHSTYSWQNEKFLCSLKKINF